MFMGLIVLLFAIIIVINAHYYMFMIDSTSIKKKYQNHKLKL